MILEEHTQINLHSDTNHCHGLSDGEARGKKRRASSVRCVSLILV